MTGSPAGSDDTPPLTIEQVRRLLGQLRHVLASEEVVLIGGQAVAVWRDYLADYLDLPPTTVASKDLDFQGRRVHLLATAEALRGIPQMPNFDNMAPMVGFVTFVDEASYDRQVDFLPSPHGLTAEPVIRRARTIKVPIDGDDFVPVHVLHPVDCLLSRVANSLLPSKQTARAWHQLAAAISIVPAYGRFLLDHDADVREVTDLNERVYEIAYYSSAARQLEREKHIDIADALLDDPRLPKQHLTEQLPRLRTRLQTRRGSLVQPAPATQGSEHSTTRQTLPEFS